MVMLEFSVNSETAEIRLVVADDRYRLLAQASRPPHSEVGYRTSISVVEVCWLWKKYMLHLWNNNKRNNRPDMDRIVPKNNIVPGSQIPRATVVPPGTNAPSTAVQ